MRNILFSGNVKVFDGILTGMLSIFMRTKSTEPYRIYIFTIAVEIGRLFALIAFKRRFSAGE